MAMQQLLRRRSAAKVISNSRTDILCLLDSIKILWVRSIIAYMLVYSGSVAYLCELMRHIKVVVLLVALPPILISLGISRGADTKEGLVVSMLGQLTRLRTRQTKLVSCWCRVRPAH